MLRSPGAVLVNIPGTTMFVRDRDNADLSKYTWVELGPVPGAPEWHIQSNPQRHAFLTPEVASRFAQAHKRLSPGREVTVEYLTATNKGTDE